LTLLERSIWAYGEVQLRDLLDRFQHQAKESSTILSSTLRFWPGFHGLWTKGDFHALLVSILFGWVLAITLAANFIWPEWFSTFLGPVWLGQWVRFGLWVILTLAAINAAVRPMVISTVGNGASSSERQKNLELAQEFYLQANYFEAEKLVRKNLAKGAEDVESSLLWIAILRRTRRIPQALELISSTDRLDVALPWMAELRSEKEQCLRLKLQTPPAHD
jgi:hypothetical protein